MTSDVLSAPRGEQRITWEYFFPKILINHWLNRYFHILLSCLLRKETPVIPGIKFYAIVCETKFLVFSTRGSR